MDKPKHSVIFSQKAREEVLRLVEEGRTVRTPEVIRESARRAEAAVQALADSRKRANEYGARNMQRKCDC